MQGTANPEAIQAIIMNACEARNLSHDDLSSIDGVSHKVTILIQIAPSSFEPHDCHKPKLDEDDSIFVDPL